MILLATLLFSGNSCYADDGSNRENSVPLYPKELKARGSFNELHVSAGRPHNVPPHGDKELRGFFPVPGSDAALRLEGFVKVDAIYDLRPAGNPDELVTSSIPTASKSLHSGNNFTIHAKQTRLSLEIRNSTERGELKLYLENDFFGTESGYEYRLTSAYGQLGNCFAGYAPSAFSDVDALPNTLDAEGPSGSIFTRTTSFRHHWTPSRNLALTLSAEQPETQISPDLEALEFEEDRGIEFEPASRVPDVVATARLSRHWGHVQLGGVLRTLMVEVGSRDDTTGAAGAQVSGVVNVTARDSFQFSLYSGSGISRYVNDFGGIGVDALVDREGDLHRLDADGGYLAYTHHWDTAWNSNVVLSMASLENVQPRICPGNPTNTPDQLCDYPRETRYTVVNLLWTPSTTISAGIEALYGYKESQAGASGETGRIQVSVKYRFIP
ncbi:DcaP family trimeric outer membrane transporter [Microbulbifer halophilus]|uniref:DcaP family trimeric outer membrane transporter n=1 Tax=Microbulbifer halophilus TaxID=453963 RepID=A0ABW5EFV0_9GAMM|nr:DcaP family trimeric outer membrane transporter [Microbulbifer halophilus]